MAPSYAFGDVLYASNLMAAATTNAAALQASARPAPAKGIIDQIEAALAAVGGAPAKQFMASAAKAVGNVVSRSTAMRWPY